MHPWLLYDIVLQKQAEEIRRAEQDRLAAAVIREDHGLRHRLAAILVAVAGQLQPGLRREIRTSARSEAA